MHRYTISTTKPLHTLRGLRATLLLACEAAVRMGDAEPASVINEIRGVLGTLTDRWRGKRRDEVLRTLPVTEHVT